MCKNIAITTITALIITGGLTACSPIEKITKKNVSPTAITFKSNGEPVVLDTSSGKPLPTCDERDNPETSKGLGPCNVYLDIKRDKEGRVTDVRVLDKKTGMELPRDKIKKIITTTTVIYEGSHCEISDIGGFQFSSCWPWPHD